MSIDSIAKDEYYRYNVMLEYSIDKILSTVKKFRDLDDAVKYTNKENDELKKEWTGDFKYFFIRDMTNNVESMDGENWQTIK